MLHLLGRFRPDVDLQRAKRQFRAEEIRRLGIVETFEAETVEGDFAAVAAVRLPRADRHFWQRVGAGEPAAIQRRRDAIDERRDSYLLRLRLAFLQRLAQVPGDDVIVAGRGN